MTLKIVKGQYCEGRVVQLALIDKEFCRGCMRLESETVRRVAAAMIARLQIPDTGSIVGLLGVGLSACNRDELLDWVSSQEDLIGLSDDEILSVLELRFRSAVDRYPEP